MRSKNAQAVILSLERIFATHGLPDEITSDNGPPFQSKEFNDFIKMKGIIHQKVTPLWPQANGLVESFMKPLTKAVRTMHLEGCDWWPTVYQFLLNYRCTPHSTTGVSPAEMLYNRSLCNGIPAVDTSNNLSTDQHRKAATLDQQRKVKMKEYADRNHRVQECTLKVGQTVLLKQEKRNKFSSRYDHRPFRIIAIKGTMVTAERAGIQRTHHISHIKPDNSPLPDKPPNLSDIDEEGEERRDPRPELKQDQRYPARERQRPDYYVKGHG